MTITFLKSLIGGRAREGQIILIRFSGRLHFSDKEAKKQKQLPTFATTTTTTILARFVVLLKQIEIALYRVD